MKEKIWSVTENIAMGTIKTAAGSALTVLGYYSFPGIQLVGAGALALGSTISLGSRLLNYLGVKDKLPNKVFSYSCTSLSRLGDSLLTAPISGAWLATEGLASIITMKKYTLGIKILNKNNNKIESYGPGYLLTDVFPHLYRNQKSWPASFKGITYGVAKGIAKTGAGYALTVSGIVAFPVAQALGAALLVAGFVNGKENGNPFRRIGDSLLTSPISGVVLMTEGVSSFILQKDIQIGVKKYNESAEREESFGVGYLVTDIVPRLAYNLIPSQIKSMFSSNKKEVVTSNIQESSITQENTPKLKEHSSEFLDNELRRRNNSKTPSNKKKVRVFSD